MAISVRVPDGLPDLSTLTVADLNPLTNEDGEVNPYVEYLLERVKYLHEENRALHDELGIKLVMIKRLRSDEANRLRNHRHFPAATEVLLYWKEKCHQNARGLEGERLKNVIDRLSEQPEAYTVEMLKLCVDGYTAYPYLVSGVRRPHGRPAQRKVDAEFIFRDPRRVDDGIALAEQLADLEAPMVADSVQLRAAPPPELSPMGQTAYRLASRGWYIFPIKANEKAPATPHGLLDAKPDPYAAQRYWLAHPDANVGLRCGKETGIVVLDVDGEVGNESLRKLERFIATRDGDTQPLPPTRSVVTPSGGQHYYFEHPQVDIRNTQGLPVGNLDIEGVVDGRLLGLDIRGDGGYVLCPPSMVDGRRYEVDEVGKILPMPEWLRLLLLADQMTSRGKADTTRWLALARGGIGEGQRNGEMVSFVGHLVSSNLPEEEVVLYAMLVNERFKPPMDESEVLGVIESVKRMRAREAAKEVIG